MRIRNDKNIALGFSGALLLSAITSNVTFADAYIKQLDQQSAPTQFNSGSSGGAYIEQAPAHARPRVQPVTRKKQSPVRRAAVRPAKSKASELSAAAGPGYPDVGAGVSLALAPSELGRQLPSVGKGVVRQ